MYGLTIFILNKVAIQPTKYHDVFCYAIGVNAMVERDYYINPFIITLTLARRRSGPPGECDGGAGLLEPGE